VIRRFDPAGKLLREGRSNGTYSVYGYTNRDWLSVIEHYNKNDVLLDRFTYGYTNSLGEVDRTGRVLSETDLLGRLLEYSYSKTGELRQEGHPDFGVISYSYDLNGNRRTKTTSAGTDYYGIGANNKLLWVNRGTDAAPTEGQAQPYTLYTYDGAGRTTYRSRKYASGLNWRFKYGWDGDNRLRQIDQVADAGGSNPFTRFGATYNGDGLRMQKSETWTGGHTYSWAARGIYYDTSGSALYTPGLGQYKAGQHGFYLGDQKGNTRYLSDWQGVSVSQGARYDAYGNKTAVAGSDPHFSDYQHAGAWGYQSEWSSLTDPALSLQYLQQRYYDAEVGRFLSPDPIGFAGGTNLYGYCGNDPVNAVDPLGLWTKVIVEFRPAFHRKSPGYHTFVIIQGTDSRNRVRQYAFSFDPEFKPKKDIPDLALWLAFSWGKLKAAGSGKWGPEHYDWQRNPKEKRERCTLSFNPAGDINALNARFLMIQDLIEKQGHRYGPLPHKAVGTRNSNSGARALLEYGLGYLMPSDPAGMVGDGNLNLKVPGWAQRIVLPGLPAPIPTKASGG
jgi:RHS repeat-associated protein